MSACRNGTGVTPYFVAFVLTHRKGCWNLAGKMGSLMKSHKVKCVCSCYILLIWIENYYALSISLLSVFEDIEILIEYSWVRCPLALTTACINSQCQPVRPRSSSQVIVLVADFDIWFRVVIWTKRYLVIHVVIWLVASLPMLRYPWPWYILCGW